MCLRAHKRECGGCHSTGNQNVGRLTGQRGGGGMYAFGKPQTDGGGGSRFWADVLYECLFHQSFSTFSPFALLFSEFARICGSLGIIRKFNSTI